jgi:hypothetical protein
MAVLVAVETRQIVVPLLNLPTLVSCGESRRDSRISHPVEKLPRVNASRFQLEANCMHVVKLKRVAMRP